MVSASVIVGANQKDLIDGAAFRTHQNDQALASIKVQLNKDINSSKYAIACPN